jgi:hypothetical protein
MATGNDPPRVKGFQNKATERPAPPPSQKDTNPPAASPVSLSRKFASAVQPPTEVPRPADTGAETLAAPAVEDVFQPSVTAQPIAELPAGLADPAPAPPTFTDVEETSEVVKPAAPVPGLRARFQPAATPADPGGSIPSSVFVPPATGPVSSSPVGRDAVLPSPAPVSNYTPDIVVDRMKRRRWWKYNLAVKAGREAPAGKN